MLHRLGEPTERDVLLFTETDETFWVAVHESRSRELILVHCEHTDRAEAWAISSDDPASGPRRIIPRGAPHEFQLDHFRGRFLIRTNRGAPDFRLVTTTEERPADETSWTDLVPARQDVQLEGFEIFETHLALFERR